MEHSMFLTSILFLVAFLQVGHGELLHGGKSSTALNNSSLNLIIGDQCVTRDEVQAIIQSEVQSIATQVNEIQNTQQQLLQIFRPGTFVNPASSCKYIPKGSPSGEYYIQTETGCAQLVYCDMTRTCGSCNTTGGWMRVANLDMTDPNQQCPSGFRLVTSPRRSCGRVNTGCVSTTFPVYGVQYSRVCGRIIGYQQSTPDAFQPYYLNQQVTINDVYVDGISLTHGRSPRKHVWTFAAAVDELRSNQWVCPCTRPDLTFTGVVPPFVGQDYFCETGSRNTYEWHRFYFEDPLWNGEGCGPRSTCCNFSNPPWFCKQLSQPTKDNIELRLCANAAPISNEDIPIEIVELYVQ